MPLDSQQPNSHCYWLTTYSELLCVCSHSHLYWYETAQTPELGRGRQAGSVGRYHESLLPPFLTPSPAAMKNFHFLATIQAVTRWKCKCSSRFQSLFHRSCETPLLCMYTVNVEGNLPVCIFVFVQKSN